MTAGPRQPGVVSRRARNDPAQYDDLAREWWRPHGAFAMLHWIAEARSALVPPASRPGAVLVDIGCGGGPLAPHKLARCPVCPRWSPKPVVYHIFVAARSARLTDRPKSSGTDFCSLVPAPNRPVRQLQTRRSCFGRCGPGPSGR